MFRKIVVAVLTLLFGCHVSLAQSGKNNDPAGWELLEVSEQVISYSNVTVPTRNYYYRTSETTVIGESSLEWMKTSGWELVAVLPVPDNPSRFFFKRPFVKTRTDNEIKQLRATLEKLNQTPPKSANVLVDLDEAEFKQKLADYNRNEEANVRAALEQIKNLSLKTISVQSKSQSLERTSVGAEVVIDATSVLLKDGKNYRSSEAEKFFLEAVKQITDGLRLSTGGASLTGNAQRISKGYYSPQPIGKYTEFYDGFGFKVSVVINAAGQQNVVAQGIVYASRLRENR